MADVNYHALSGTTSNLDAVKAPGLIAIDTTKDHLVAYKEDGTTLRHLITADSGDNIINLLGNIIQKVNSYLGLSASTARISFPDTATVQVDDADLVVDAGGVYADSAVINTTTLVVNKSGYEDKVGIGTATPAYPLDIVRASSDAAYDVVQIQNLNSGRTSSIKTINNDASATAVYGIMGTTQTQTGAVTGGGLLGTVTNSPLNICTNDITRVVILGNGQLGLNTPSPVEKLSLNQEGDSSVDGISLYVAKSSAAKLRGLIYHTGGTVGMVIANQRAAGTDNTGDIVFQTAPSASVDHNTEATLQTSLIIKANGDLVSEGDVYAKLGLHVGGTSDPGDDNLLVDGTATIGTLSVTGNTCLTASTLYLGATTTTANKWRIYDDGTNLLFQRYESSSWVTKVTMAA